MNGKPLKPSMPSFLYAHDWFHGIFIYLTQYVLQIPHAFQQRLSAEKTPTLCDAIPSFEAMIRVWKEHQVKHPETAGIVQAGLDKLGTYQEHADLNPMYVVAMGKFHSLFP